MPGTGHCLQTKITSCLVRNGALLIPDSRANFLFVAEHPQITAAEYYQALKKRPAFWCAIFQRHE